MTEILERALSLSPDNLVCRSPELSGSMGWAGHSRRVLRAACGLYKAGIVDCRGHVYNLGGPELMGRFQPLFGGGRRPASSQRV